MLSMKSDEEIMQELVKYAHLKIVKNNAYPFCTFIVKNGVILAKGYNIRVNAYGDKTMHGEMEAMRRATTALANNLDLSGCTLYSTCEPCLACFESALWTKTKRFVIGITHDDFPEYFHDHPYTIEDYEIDNPGDIEVVRNVCHEQNINLFQLAKEIYGW